MDMKKLRDQARKDNKAQKSGGKGSDKTKKASAETLPDSVIAIKEAVSKKEVDSKDEVVQVGKMGNDSTHSGKNAVAKGKHH